MFGSFNPKDDSLTSLDLRTPAPRKQPPAPAPPPASDAKADTKAPAMSMCVAQATTLEGAYLHFTGTRRRLDEMVKTGLRPQVLFYIVFPQQGLTHSLTTNDGLKTIVPIFNSRPMADAFIAAKKLAAVAAACKVENLARQAEQWMSSGINSYTLNTCCRCLSLTMSSITELQEEEVFLAKWRLDLANRQQFAEHFGRNAAAAIGTNRKQARIWLEGLRDHIEAANPYVHWVIAVLAGIDGDMESNAASIKRLEAFGPPFVGKLHGTSFDITGPDSQLTTMAEAVLGLGISLGYLDPAKMSQAPQQPQLPFDKDSRKSGGDDDGNRG